jgi:hypothetical protein
VVEASVRENVILIAGPHETADAQAESICDIATRLGVDLNKEWRLPYGHGYLTRKMLISQLNVFATMAEAAGYEILRKSDDILNDDDIDIEISLTVKRRR